jgi:hypothetical protein
MEGREDEAVRNNQLHDEPTADQKISRREGGAAVAERSLVFKVCKAGRDMSGLLYGRLGPNCS